MFALRELPRGLLVCFLCPGQPPRAIQLLQCRLRLERFGFSSKCARAKDLNGRIRACEFRALAAAVNGKAGGDVGGDAGVSPAIAANEQIEPPALSHADRLPALGLFEQSGEVLFPDLCNGVRSMADGFGTEGNDDGLAVRHAFDLALQDLQLGWIDEVVR
jgi:hypothetical protein